MVESGPRRTTLKMVAEEAGVSTATVSYVLAGRAGGDAGVRPETALRVREAATRLRYQPHQAARTLRTGKSGVIQLCLHMLSDPWSLAVVDAVNATANEHGLTTMILADGDWYAALERQECDVAYIDGVSRDSDGRAKLDSLAARGRRLVVFDEQLESGSFEIIRSRPLAGCRLAVEHLLDNHPEIGCLTASAILRTPGPSRYTAYLDALAARGIAMRHEWVKPFENTHADAAMAAMELLTAPDRPTAVYATTDFAALALIRAAEHLGLRVPHDVAVIGVGNTPDGAFSQPTLSTVGPVDFFGRQAEIIVQTALSSAPQQHRVHQFSGQLIPRRSTGHPG
jgi:DNA-binding LacI/PurR family transcriptional regulator